MNKSLLFALAGLLLAAAPALAHPPAAANVNFTSERGVPFGLMLDGQPLTRGVARQVHVAQVRPGEHWADFTVPMAYGGAVRFRSRVWLRPGLETSFVLLARPGRPLDLREVSEVDLCGPAGYPGGYGYGAGNGHYNAPQPYNSPTPYGQGSYGASGYPSGGANDDDPDDNATDYPNGSNGNTPNGGNNGGYGNYPGNGSNSNGTYPNSAGNNGYPSNGGNAHGYPGNGGNNGYPGGIYPGAAPSGYRLMAAPEVSGLVQAMQQRPFEASKLSTAKEVLGHSRIQADDLKRVLRGLGFEDSRVELAKFAYAHVADPQNFYRVYEAFDFDSSVQEVQAAVGAVPPH